MRDLKNIFIPNQMSENMAEVIHQMKKIFFSISHEDRTKKHISDPSKRFCRKEN